MAKLDFRNVSRLFLISLLFLSFFCKIPAYAQNYSEIHKQFRFRNITVDNGLSNNLVQTISEDQNGYVWIGTRFGLNKHNGIEIKNYYHNINDSTTIPSDMINVVFCDSENNIWIGTDNGVSVYNAGTDSFNPFNKPDLPKDLKNVYDIIEDSNKQIWLATDKGLLKYNIISLELQVFTHENSGLPSNEVYRLLIARENQLLFSCYNQGVSFFNIETGSIKTFTNQPDNPESISGNMVERMYQDKNGNIWIGTYNSGLNKWNRQNSVFKRYLLDSTNSYSNRIRSIFEDNSGQLLFGSRGGVYIYKSQSDNFQLYASSSHEISKLSENSVMCNFKDSKNGLWLGTYYGGVNYANMDYKPFMTYTANENNPYFLNSSNIFGMAEDANGNLFVSSGNGINILNLSTSKFSYLTNKLNNKNSLSYNDVKSLVVVPNGDLWIATNNGGLNFYSKKNKKFTHYKNIPGDTTSLPVDKVYFVFSDSDENIWVLSNLDLDNHPSKLSLFHKESGTFKTFKEDFHLGIIEDKNKNILIGGFNGFWKYSLLNKQFTFYKNDTIIGQRVWCLHQDINENIWIGSNNGVALFDYKTELFKNCLPKEKNQANNVYGILSDDPGNLWVSTNSGLIKMINAVHFSDSIPIRIYDKDDGLPSKQFMYNSSFKNRQGEMFFGGINGFIRFHPNEIIDSKFEPNIVLSDLIIDDNTIKPGDFIGKNFKLEKEINKVDRIELNSNVKSFILKFDALHFVIPEKNSYKYILENFDENWHYANSYNNSVRYSNLPAGNYIFRIYAITNEGIYSKEPKVLKITVLPAFWETLLFRVLFIFGLLLVIYAIFRLRFAKYKRHEKILQKAVAKRTSELSISNQELKVQRNDILSKNKEIQSQNEKLLNQKKEIENNNLLLADANKNLQYLIDFGKQLTSKLNISEIQYVIEKSIDSLVPVDIIGIGLYNQETDKIVFSSLSSNGQRIPEFERSVSDPTSLSAFCFRQKEKVICNDFEKEYKNFSSKIRSNNNEIHQSVYYQPLLLRDRCVGVLTIKSLEKNIFSEKNVTILDSLLANILIALDNAFAYEIVRDQKDEIDNHRNYLEQIVAERTIHLEEAKNRAEESDRLKTSFLANMSHEIRTPLNAIIGFIDLLGVPGVTPDKATQFYNIIKKSGYTLMQLITDIIDISKIEANQLEIFYEDVLVSQFLKEIYLQFDEHLRQEQKHDKIVLTLTTPLEKETIINTGLGRLEQVFTNLLSNAIKFTFEGQIEFGIKNIIPEKEIIFFVKDTGIGIDKKNHSFIYDRFRKIEDDNSVLYRGTGLGLAITKHLVEKLGGQISLQSELGEGSEFIFSIPFEKSKNVKIETEKKSLSNSYPDWNNKVFLVVEDNDSNFLVITSILESTKVKILHAKDGEEAIQLFKENEEIIDLVLMDIKIPKKSGFEALTEIRKIKADSKIIAQTAYAMSKEKSQIRAAGFNDYISKPINYKDLIRIITLHL